MSYEKGKLFVVTDKYSYNGWVEPMTKCIGQVVRSTGEHNDFSCKCETEMQGDLIPSWNFPKQVLVPLHIYEEIFNIKLKSDTFLPIPPPLIPKKKRVVKKKK